LDLGLSAVIRMFSAPSSRGSWNAALRPLHRLCCPAAQDFPKALGIVPRGSGVNAAPLSLAQPPR